MLELGIILLILGVVLVLAPVPLPNIDAVGWLLALVGVVLIIVALVAPGHGHDAVAVTTGVYNPRVRRLLARVRILLADRR